MVKRHSAVRRRGLTPYKVYELLTGEIRYPMCFYSGYGDLQGDRGRNTVTERYTSAEMKADWEANRDALMAFWRSGEYSHPDTLAEFGITSGMKPWLWFCGSRSSLPWAEKHFGKDERSDASTKQSHAKPRPARRSRPRKRRI